MAFVMNNMNESANMCGAQIAQYLDKETRNLRVVCSSSYLNTESKGTPIYQHSCEMGAWYMDKGDK